MWDNPFAAISAAGGNPSQLPMDAVQEEVHFFTFIFEPSLFHFITCNFSSLVASIV